MKDDLTIRAGDAIEVIRDDGSVEIRTVADDPWQLGHGQWVVKLDGISGVYALNRCKKLNFKPTV